MARVLLAAFVSVLLADTFVTLPSRGAKLAGRIIAPASGSVPRPAVVLVHGSGEVTGSDMIAGPGRRLADMGFVVLAYDKRGVGQSTGEYASIGPSNSVRMFDLLAADTLAGVEALRRRPDVDKSRVGLVGYSQAGWIAPLAASRSSDVAFVVLISGPAVSVGEEIYYSRLAGEDPGSEQGLSDAEIDRRMRQFKGPDGYDPVPVLSKLATPSLWILGEHDRSIPVDRTRDTLERLKRNLGRPITTHVIPGVNHQLVATPGRLRAGGAPAGPAGASAAGGRQPDYWRTVETWLRGQKILR
jgi:dienelactone hydrolase